MASIDTNVLIRFLTGDDPDQYRKAQALFENEAIFILDTVVLESEWVLRYTYEFKPAQVCSAFTTVFGLPNVTLQNPMQLAQAIEWHREGFDFADALHVSHSKGHDPFYTFDRRLIRRATEACGVAVQEPSVSDNA